MARLAGPPAQLGVALMAGSAVADPERATLARVVKQLACTAFAIQTCCGLALLLPLALLAAMVPSSTDYERFQDMCRNGSLSEDTCRAAAQIFAGFCEARDVHGEACRSLLSDTFGHLKDGLLFLLTLGMVVLCCSSCIPMCGFCGAQTGSAFLLSCFIVWNFLASALYVLHALNFGMSEISLVPLLLQFVLPSLSFWYAYKLRTRQLSPHAGAVPLLHEAWHQQQPLHAQMPQPPYGPSAPVMTQQQLQQAQHQALHGQPGHGCSQLPAPQPQQPYPLQPSAPPAVEHEDLGY